MKGTSVNILWLMALLLVLSAWISGLFIDLTGDAGLYAAISLQMVESGDWLNLSVNGVAYDQKPHLLFWLAGPGISLLGNNNAGYKIFPFLVGLLSIYFIYRLAKLLYSPEAGKWAALMAASSQIFFLYLFDIHTDTVLQAMVIFSLWQFCSYLRYRKSLNYLLGFTGLGLAMLTKGPVGAVLPFLLVLIFLLANKDYRQLFSLKWIPGIILVLMIISPALIHLYQNFGWNGIAFYFITNNFGRISGEYAGSSSDPFYYLYNSVWMFLPWTLFVFAAVYAEVKIWFRKRRDDPFGPGLLGGIFILLLILSIARGKAPNYFFIAVPPLFVITGKWMASWSKINIDTLHKAQLVLLGVVWILFITAVILYPEGLIWLTLLTAGFILLIMFSRKQLKSLFDRSIVLSIVVFGIINLYMHAEVVPELAEYQGARQVLRIFNENKEPADHLYNFEMEEYELFFYAEEPVTDLQNWEELHEALSDSGAWIYTNQIKMNDILTMEYPIDTVIHIRQRGLNNLNIQFLNPESRSNLLNTNYLIRIK